MTENAVTLNSAGDNSDRGLGLFESRDGRIISGLPLSAVSMEASVLDAVASVTVTQTFENSLPEPMEAVYIFPLSGSCCVSSCELVIGDRSIAAVVKERGEARLEYQAALEEGRTAAIVEQERDNIFTLQVGNVLPGEEIKVVLTYSELLTCFSDGLTELRLPLVVAPKYMSGAAVNRDACGIGTEYDTNSVPDASRISPPILAAGLNPGVNLNIDVFLGGAHCTENASAEAGLQNESSAELYIEDLTCSQHAVRTAYKQGVIKVSLAKSGELLNRDFVLSWRSSGRKFASRGYISSAAYEMEGQFFRYGLLALRPPLSKRSKFSSPREIVFLLDRSGSMGGIKMASAARALTFLLDSLGPDDSFSICAFDDRIEWPCDRNATQLPRTSFLRATPAGLDKGARVLRSIDSRGGTELGFALRAAYDVLKEKRSGRPSFGRSQRNFGGWQSRAQAKAQGRSQGLNLGSGADVEPVLPASSAKKSGARGSDRASASANTEAELRSRIPQQIIVLITDGQVGEAGTVFRSIQDNAADVRLFTVGVDTAVNDAFLSRAAKLGGGTCALVSPGTQLETALRRIAREIGQPLISDLTITGSTGVRLVAQTPSTELDVFEGRPAFIFFQADEDSAGGVIFVEGKFGDGTVYSEEVVLTPSENPALPQLFARRQVIELEDQMRLNPAQVACLRDEIIALAVSHSILTRFTAFVAIDHAEIVNHSDRAPRKVVQPVQAPQNWQMLQSTGNFQSGTYSQNALRAVGGFGSNDSQRLACRQSQSWSAGSPSLSSESSWGCAGAGGGLYPASPASPPAEFDIGNAWGSAVTGSWGAPPPSPSQPKLCESVRRRIIADEQSASLPAPSPQSPQSQPAPCPQSPQNKPATPIRKAKEIAQSQIFSEDRRAELIAKILRRDGSTFTNSQSVEDYASMLPVAKDDAITGGDSSELEALAKLVVLLARFKDALRRLIAGEKVRIEETKRILEFVRLCREKASLLKTDCYSSQLAELEIHCLAAVETFFKGSAPLVLESEVILGLVNHIEKVRLDLLACMEKQDKNVPAKVGDPFWFGNV